MNVNKGALIFARTKADQNRALVDPWTLVHGGTGLAVGLLGISYGAALIGALVYEALEGSFERARFPETSGNQAVDVVVFMAAVAAGRAWNETA